MTTGLVIVVALGAALCGWALLSMMSNERHRLLTEQEISRPKTAPSASPSLTLGGPKVTVRKSPAPHSPPSAGKGAGKNVR